jgi:hypothetical protein
LGSIINVEQPLVDEPTAPLAAQHSHERIWRDADLGAQPMDF